MLDVIIATLVTRYWGWAGKNGSTDSIIMQGAVEVSSIFDYI